MKKLSLSLLFVALLCAHVAFAATPVKGRVINSKQEPVGYATVVALADSTQMAGATTDEKGRFCASVGSCGCVRKHTSLHSCACEELYLGYCAYRYARSYSSWCRRG